jgi:5-methylcytosine-specific restriction endonuclease McrA
MQFADLAYLMEIIELHCSTRGHPGKGTELHNPDHEGLVLASQQIFSLLPREKYSNGRERRALVERRIAEVLEGNYTDSEFNHLCNLIEVVFRNWTSDTGGKYGKKIIWDKFPMIYNKILRVQGHRCVYCGYLFEEYDPVMELDHIIPWKIALEGKNGSNWQFLCKDCNNAKRDLFTILQYRGREDWVYKLKGWKPEIEKRENKVRFRLFVLIRDGGCRNCGKGPREAELCSVNQTVGLSIPSNMVCLCRECADTPLD